MLDAVRGISGAWPVTPAGLKPAPVRNIPAVRGADDASGIHSASSLRVRTAAPHATINHLQHMASFVDSADGALSRTERLIATGKERVLLGERSMEDLLGEIDREVATPKFEGESALRDGVTLRVGSLMMDVRPMSAMDLGAVVESGRSHRLADVRPGGSLDPWSNQAAALRSVDAAAVEVMGLRARMGEFRSAVLDPAQRSTLVGLSVAVDTGPVGFAEAEGLSKGVRGSLGAARALNGTIATNVFALLA